MYVRIIIPEKPYSVNKMFYSNRSIKRREAVEWEQTIIEHFRDEDLKEELHYLRSQFNPSIHCIHVSIKFYFPKSILLTKENKLSSRAFDLTNMEKPLIDVVFLEKFCTEKCKNLQIDDKYITKVVSEKLLGDQHRIELEIELKPLQI